MGSTNNAAADTAVKNMTNRSDLPSDIEEGFFDSPLTGSVGFGGDNNPDDVFKVSEALVANDRLDQPTSIADDAFNSKIITAQQDMADGLKPDGLINPGGPTESRFTNLAQGGMMKAPASLDKGSSVTARDQHNDIQQREKAQHDQIMAAQQARQQTAQQNKQANDTVTKATKGVANLLKQVSSNSPKPRHSRDGESSASQTVTAQLTVDPRLRGDDANGVASDLSQITDEVFSANQRSAQYLASRDGVGDLPKYIAEGIEADGDKAIAETVDLYHQTAGLNQNQADALINKVMPDLSPENAKRLQTVINPKGGEQPKNAAHEALLNDPRIDESRNWTDANGNRIPSLESESRIQKTAGAMRNEDLESRDFFSSQYPMVQNFGASNKSVKQDMPPQKNLKGTTFFGGAGMTGGYISDMQKALEETGFKNVRTAQSDVWSKGVLPDAIGTVLERNRDEEMSDFSNFKTKGEQFNLIGYSHGALQAAQAAADYADSGGKVDNLVLIGAPVSQDFLNELQSHPNIGNVVVKDLKEHDDDIKAGMSIGEQLFAVPSLAVDYLSEADDGHFYYSGDNALGSSRRRELAKWLKTQGLK